MYEIKNYVGKCPFSINFQKKNLIIIIQFFSMLKRDEKIQYPNYTLSNDSDHINLNHSSTSRVTF